MEILPLSPDRVQLWISNDVTNGACISTCIAAFQTIFLWLLGWTPGKWLMGLRVMKCADSHLTRTMPGYSVRIKPGGKISFIQ